MRISQQKTFLGCVACLLASMAAAAPGNATPPENAFAVRGQGAVGDGVANDTAAVQAAIDACTAAGGGTVYFGPGTYSCGSVHLKSRVTLWIDNGAVIKGRTRKEDYDPREMLDFKNDADVETSFFHQSLLWGEDIEHVAIAGFGDIDSGFKSRGGPKPIALKRCRFVDIRGIRIVNAPNYAISLLGTDYVTIDGVTILNAFADGIDPDSCKNVRISNCHIESVDDAIVPKASFSLGERRVCENISVTNCYLATRCNGFKLGTESGGGFKRIAVSNCVISGRQGKSPALSGIALESVDGGDLDGVAVSNITMVDVRSPIFLRLGNRGRDMETPVPGTLRNVVIDNIVATRASLACSIAGIPGHSIENVTLSNIRIQFIGGNPRHPANVPVPEEEARYPESVMFGALPAYAFFIRHVDGLRLSGIDVSHAPKFWRLTTDVYRDISWTWDDTAPSMSEPGHPGLAIYCEDVCRLDLNGLSAFPSPDGAALLWLKDVQGALLRGISPEDNPRVIAEIAGPRCKNIHVDAAGFSMDAFTLGEDVPPGAVPSITKAP